MSTEISSDKSRRVFVKTFALGVAAYFLLPKNVYASDGSSGNKEILDFANGKFDATAVIQGMIDKCAAAGLPVIIPGGAYLINPDVGLMLRSGTRISFSPGAQLMTAPSKNANYGILRIYDVNNISIKGGVIGGERQRHLGKGGEWGMGIDIKGSSDVVIEGTTVSDCWGDGVYIGMGVNNHAPSKNVTLQRVVCTNNRRQGLSLVGCDGVKVIDSIFKNTAGARPSAGIDIEPNKDDPVKNILISNCQLSENAGPGISMWYHADGVKIVGCTISNNQQGGILIRGQSTKGIFISKNTISNNKPIGIYVGKEVRPDGYDFDKNTLNVPLLGRGIQISK